MKTSEPIPEDILELVCSAITQVQGTTLPFKLRGITVDRKKIKAALEILNAHPQRTLPQNCRNDIRAQTPDGLDRRLKERMGSDLRMANFISDVLAKANIVEIVPVKNPFTGRTVKGTKLKEKWCWGTPPTEEHCYPPPGKKELSGKKGRGPAPPLEDKKSFLKSAVVQDFINLLKICLDGDSFRHEYIIKRKLSV